MSAEEIRQKLIEDCNEESCNLIGQDVKFKDEESEISTIELVSSLLIQLAEKQQDIDQQKAEIEKHTAFISHLMKAEQTLQSQLTEANHRGVKLANVIKECIDEDYFSLHKALCKALSEYESTKVK